MHLTIGTYYLYCKLGQLQSLKVHITVLPDLLSQQAMVANVIKQSKTAMLRCTLKYCTGFPR